MASTEHALKAREAARTLVCDDCGEKFRGVFDAESHASSTYVLAYMGYI